MADQREAALGYRPELDGLRALAIIAVLLFHSSRHGPFSGGFIGVDLFFVLSAFLITGILDRRQPLSIFYVRRACRLVPALLLMLAAYLIAAPFVWPGYPHARDALLAAVYVTDYTKALLNIPEYVSHTWSLSIEEQFYLLWPFLLPVLSKSKSPQTWLLSAYVFLTLWRASFLGHWEDYYYRLDTHATGLVAGAWFYFARPRVTGAVAFAAAFMLLVVCTTGEITSASLAITPAEIGSVIILAWALQRDSVFLRTLAPLGRISYGIYLWHYPVSMAVRDHLPYVESACLIFFASTAAAAVSYFTVEAWGRRQAKHFQTWFEARRQIGVKEATVA